MSSIAVFVVRVQFDDEAQCKCVARYLPEEGRAWLIDDVAADDRAAYKVIRSLEYAWVEELDQHTLRCRFGFEESEDPDADAAKVLARFAALGGKDLVGLLINEGIDCVYVTDAASKTEALYLPDAQQRSLIEIEENGAFAIIDEVLRARPKRWNGTRWDAPSSPPEPLLVPLELDAAEDDCDGDD